MQCLLNAVFKPPETCDTEFYKRQLGNIVVKVRSLSEEIKKQDQSNFTSAKDIERQKELTKDLKTNLADVMLQVYRILGKAPLPLANTPNFAKQRRQLVHSSLIAEERRYGLFPRLSDLSTTNKQQFRRPEGGNRFFNQVAFFNYLESIDGSLVIESLEREMDTEERRIFAKTINYLLSQLAPAYLELLSYIEVEKFLVHSGVITKLDSEYYSDLEDHLRQLVASRVQKSVSCIFPFGWALPGEQVGHHMLLWADRDESSERKMSIRYIDTTVVEENSTVSKTHIASHRLGGIRTGEQENAHSFDLSSKKCSVGFSDVECSDAIARIARILMLQIPEFAQKAILNSKDDPRMFLLKVNYSLGAGRKELVEEETPLSRWKWYESPSCSLASFQPLLQEIANKFLRQENIVNIELEQHLKGYFELLMQSYKVFLVKNFFNEQSSGLSKSEAWLSRGYLRAIHEEACETIHHENLLSESVSDDPIKTRREGHH